MSLDEDLLKILACPQCHGQLSLTGRQDGLRCSVCRVCYPVREEIPILLVQAAVDEAQWPPDKDG